MRAWVGTSGYQYPEWRGKFYPEGLPTGRMLGFYGEHFETTESNYTFRHTPSAKTIERWKSGTPSAFVFGLKAPQRITHFARLADGAETVRAFHRATKPLGPKRGPVLFQLPENFHADAKRLRSFLKLLPKGMRAAFEFRHASWFAEEVYEILRRANVALCLAESDELTTPPIPTADFGYLRLRRVDYKPAELRRWAAFIEAQAGAWSDAYLYFKHEETASGPRLARKMQKLLAAFASPAGVA